MISSPYCFSDLNFNCNSWCATSDCSSAFLRNYFYRPDQQPRNVCRRILFGLGLLLNRTISKTRYIYFPPHITYMCLLKNSWTVLVVFKLLSFFLSNSLKIEGEMWEHSWTNLIVNHCTVVVSSPLLWAVVLWAVFLEPLSTSSFSWLDHRFWS